VATGVADFAKHFRRVGGIRNVFYPVARFFAEKDLVP